MLNSNFIKKGQTNAVDNSVLLQREAEQDALDAKCGFRLYREGPPKLGWLINFNTCAIEDKDAQRVASAVACYFMCQSGEMFKCKLPFAPYFYLQVKDDRELEVEAYLRRKFEGVQQTAHAWHMCAWLPCIKETASARLFVRAGHHCTAQMVYAGLIKSVDIVHREDLSLKNHLAGHQRKLMTLTFDHTQQLQEVKAELLPIIAKNKAKAARADAYSVLAALNENSSSAATVAVRITCSVHSANMRHH